MPTQIVPVPLSEDKRRKLGLYLNEQWLRAKRGRQSQVDDRYAGWQKAYSGVPLEEIRTVPFYKSSNFVVKLIRMFLDTFMARSLNVIFATRPLFICDGLPEEIKEGWELYLNRKAMYEWDYYNLTKSLTLQGNKNGTAIVKTPWVEKESWSVQVGQMGTPQESKVLEFAGPCSQVIPFDDFFLYPITCTDLNKAEILFHRLRYIKEDAQRKQDSGEWTLPKGQDLVNMCRHPADVQRQEEQADAGVVDPYLLELEVIECHLKWAVTNDSTKLYNIVALFQPATQLILDCYYNPYPQNLCIFQDYRPFPRDDIFYGESMCELLGQSQEEASRIHNERRDNSTIASSVCFKRRSGSLIPNPSTNWYPGKVWDLEDMTDLDTFDVGRNYENMIQQEDYVFTLAEKLSGIGELMQGASQGMLGQRGVYNTTGTLSVLAEGNQRQDTNIKDVRCVLSQIGKVSSRLQAIYGGNDPFIQTLPTEAQQAVQQALQIFKSDAYKYIQLEVKASTPGANSEVRKANLMLMGQVLGQYGQTAVQMASQLANQQLNPVIRTTMSEFIDMQRWMAKRLLKELDEWDATEILPDVNAAIAQASQPTGSQQSSPRGPQQGSIQPGGANGALPPLSGAQLQTIASLPPTQGGPPQ
jgi:hypothetical protein